MYSLLPIQFPVSLPIVTPAETSLPDMPTAPDSFIESPHAGKSPPIPNLAHRIDEYIKNRQRFLTGKTAPNIIDLNGANVRIFGIWRCVDIFQMKAESQKVLDAVEETVGWLKFCYLIFGGAEKGDGSPPDMLHKIAKSKGASKTLLRRIKDLESMRARDVGGWQILADEFIVPRNYRPLNAHPEKILNWRLKN